MTPIYKIDEFNGNNIYIKREDFIPISFGGNKARKAMNFYQEIDEGDYDCVVTYGSSSSNHCRIISNMAASRGMECYIIGPQESSEETYNSRLMELFGADITVVPVEEVSKTIDAKIEALKAEGKKPYFIAGGGHGNLGTKAYVSCFDEIKAQEKEMGMKFDSIYFASGTGTTQAGLVCGKLIHGDEVEVVGISIARKCPRGRDVVVDSIKEYFDETGFSYSYEDVEKATIFLDDYVGGGYGAEMQTVNNNIESMMVKNSIPMDPTYTGKAYSGMLEEINKKGLSGKNILFIHTGGTPLFFDWLNKR